MVAFEPRNVDFRPRVEARFARQRFLSHLGCSLTFVAPGTVDIALAFNSDLGHAHGCVHGGVVTSIAESAAACAALTLAPAERDVITTELKVNFLRPAGEGRLVAQGRIIKPGRTLMLCQADVMEERQDQRVHVLTGLVTVMTV